MTRPTGRLAGILRRGTHAQPAATPSQHHSPNASEIAVERPRAVALAIQAANDDHSRPAPTRAELRAAFLAGGNATLGPDGRG